MGQARHLTTRRAVLKGATGLVIGLHLPFSMGRATGAAEAGSPTPNAFLRIGTDDTVTVVVKHLEMGQGPMTGLATLVAEELDADWSQMRAEHAPVNTSLYKNFAIGAQATGGSTAIANSYMQMRRAGAQARAMLVQAAADAWKVPVTSITVDKGVLHHRASNRGGNFGIFAMAAAALAVPMDVKLKDEGSFRLIGRAERLGRLDSQAKSNGTAQYAMDIQEPGMLTVVVARPPRFGAKVARLDSAAARAVKGVVAIETIETGVAVYGEGTWPAIKGRNALKIVWDESAAETRSTSEIVSQFSDLARTPGPVAGAVGDTAAAFAQAEQVIETQFTFPYLAHGPMEPLDGYLRWNDTGAVARFGCQIQTLDQAVIAGVLGLQPSSVEIETMLAGGGFGRRGQFDSHFAKELAQVAKAIGSDRPVKLIWTREDDLTGGYYRSIFVHRLHGAVSKGRIVAWENTVVGQSFIQGTPFEGAMIREGVDATMVEGSRELLYEIPDFRCYAHMVKVGVPVLWWRSVGHTHTGYAVECFIDQLLIGLGKDPIRGRLEMLKGQPRATGVLRAVAKLAGWSGPGPREGRAWGVAVVQSFGTYVAQIAEVSAGGANGIRVHKVWCAVDCGVAVNPDVVVAQMEGGIGYGLSHVLFNGIDLDGGRVSQQNFDTYRCLRIHEMPPVEVTIVPSTAAPSGAGEPGVPPIGPAVANALAALGLERPRQLPMLGSSA